MRMCSQSELDGNGSHLSTDFTMATMQTLQIKQETSIERSVVSLCREQAIVGYELFSAGKNVQFSLLCSTLYFKEHPSVVILLVHYDSLHYHPLIRWNHLRTTSKWLGLRLRFGWNLKFSFLSNRKIIFLRVCGRNGPLHKFLSRQNSVSAYATFPVFVKDLHQQSAFSYSDSHHL